MGRQANAVDWADEGGSGVLRAIADSEIRLRERSPLSPFEEEIVMQDEDDEPTRPVSRPPLLCALSSCAGRGTRDPEPLSARGIARLSALADWLAGEESASAAVTLVRAFLRAMDRVEESMSALFAASGDPPVTSGLEAAVHSLAFVIGMWRGNMVEQVDDLALSDHRSLCGWSSLPEYSCAYALAFLQPALADARAWVIATCEAARQRTAILAALDAIGEDVRELNATLRGAIDAHPRPALVAVPAATAW